MKSFNKKLLREGLMTDYGNELIFNKSSYNDNSFYYDILDKNGQNIGQITLLDLTNDDYFKQQGIDGYIVTNSSVKIRNKGIGRDAYKTLINNLDKPIFSDTSRTNDANKLWDYLVKNGIATYNSQIDRYHSI